MTARPRLAGVPAAAPLVAVAGTALAGVLAATWLAAAGQVPGLAQPGQGVVYGIPALRLLLELSATATLGLMLVPTLVGAGRPAGRAGSRQPADVLGLAGVLGQANRLAVVAIAGWLGAAPALLVLQTAELRPATPVTAGALVDYVRTFGAGQVLVVSATAAAICAVAGAFALRPGANVPWLPRAALAAAGLVPLVYAGHATAQTSPWHAMMADLVALHVLAAAVWTGGLAAVLTLVARRPDLLAVTLPRFSRLAGGCLATIAVTGVFNAAVELSSAPGARLPGVLTTSDYGLIVLAKAGCLVVLAAVGWRMRYRLLPAVVRGRRTALVAWGTGELAVLALAFGLAVALARTAVVG